MGITRGAKVSYQCSNDCRQSGCPGHIVRVDFDRSTDIYLIIQDDEILHCLDENLFAAILKSDELSTQELKARREALES